VSAVCPGYSLIWRAFRKKYAGTGPLILVPEAQLEPTQGAASWIEIDHKGWIRRHPRGGEKE
jgi:hypothetical protein